MNTENLKSIINNYLEDYFKEKQGYNKKIYEAMSYSLNIGGKRIRPLLLLLTFNMYNECIEEVVPFAAALEMIHTYSLIHDDLPAMDNDDLRRGKSTNHKVFGEAIAILAGDGLLNESANLMLKSALKGGENLIQATYEILNSAGAEGMIGGQVVDILNEGKDITLGELNYMHIKKTGELIKTSIVAGAILAKAKKEDINVLSEFGYKLGIAFQIKDDILDIVSTTEILGKKTNSDTQNNKTNFISMYGLEECEKRCIELTNDCITLLDKLEKDSSKLKEITLLLLNRKK
jgi:geranylgeranyl diphosphate synthase type II